MGDSYWVVRLLFFRRSPVFPSFRILVALIPWFVFCIATVPFLRRNSILFSPFCANAKFSAHFRKRWRPDSLEEHTQFTR